MKDGESADGEPQRKKGGRPRRHAPDAKRPTMAFRIGSSLHEKLIAASIANERSLSEEIERRVEASFETKHQEEVLDAILGGGMLASFRRDVLAVTTRLFEPMPNAPTYELERRALMRAIQKIAEHYLPDRPFGRGAIERTERWENLCRRAEELAEKAAQNVINDALAELLDDIKAQAQQMLQQDAGDLQSFAGSSGLMGRWATEDGVTAAATSVAPPTPEKFGSKS